MTNNMEKTTTMPKGENVRENFFTTDGNALCAFLAEAKDNSKRVENVFVEGILKGMIFVSDTKKYEFWFDENGRTRVVIREFYNN